MSLTTTLTTYKYEALSTARQEIRLVTIVPGHPDDDVYVSLSTLPLRDDFEEEWTGIFEETLDEMEVDEDDDDQDGDYEDDPMNNYDEDEEEYEDYESETEENGDNVQADLFPGYEALSYVWGSPDDPQPVYVQGAPQPNNVISGRRNLAVALRSLRHETSPPVLWIDAICINQGDNIEKGHQVTLMGKISKMAKDVTIWLGPAAQNSDRAFQIMQDIGTRFKVDWVRLRATSSVPDALDAKPNWQYANDLGCAFEDDEKEAVYHLIARPWFERLWVRRELCLAERPVLHCGTATIPWSIFRTAAFTLQADLSRHKHVSPGGAPSQLSILESAYGARLDLVVNLGLQSVFPNSLRYDSLRRSLAGIRWGDSRDAIFAVKHLLAQQESELGIEADYTKEAPTIYREVAEKTIAGTGSLDILSTCELETVRPATASLMPSWVPDWSSHMRCPKPFIIYWSACAFISPQAGFQADGVLVAAGLGVAEVTDARPFPRSEWIEAQPTHIKAALDLTKEIVSREDDLKASYKHGWSNPLAFHYCDIFLSTTEFPEYSDDLDASILTWWDAAENIQRYWDGGELDADILTAGECCPDTLVGRCFFRTGDGHFWVGPVNVEPDDVVCVILGCRQPMILRPVTTPTASTLDAAPPRYVIVGNCFLSGIDHGEMISPIFKNYEVKEVRRGRWGMKNSQDGTIITDQSRLLEEAGIAVARYQQDPHVLEVLPDTLRRKGVRLEHFHLQ